MIGYFNIMLIELLDIQDCLVLQNACKAVVHFNIVQRDMFSYPTNFVCKSDAVLDYDQLLVKHCYSSVVNLYIKQEVWVEWVTDWFFELSTWMALYFIDARLRRCNDFKSKCERPGEMPQDIFFRCANNFAN